MSSNLISLNGFRRLLRTSQAAFKGDNTTLRAAREQLRVEFLKNKNVIDTDELSKLHKGIEEVDEMLRFNIVQGTMNQRGNFDVNLSEENKVAVESGQNDPTGTDFQPIDQSILGKDVKIETVKKRNKK